MNEYECQCGYIWIDNHNYGCPMCGKQDDVIRHDYIIRQPITFDRKKQNANEKTL